MADEQPNSGPPVRTSESEMRRDSTVDASHTFNHTAREGTSNVVSDQTNDSTSEKHTSTGPSTTGNTDSSLMPPPSAPASMLYSIRASKTALPAGKRHQDPFVCSRLTAVTVTLFREGKGKEAKALAHFTVDLVEWEFWDKYLQMYMNAESESVDTLFAVELLEEAREELQKVDAVQAGFLAVLKGLIHPT